MAAFEKREEERITMAMAMATNGRSGSKKGGKVDIPKGTDQHSSRGR
jgi:hypothetical protein